MPSHIKNTLFLATTLGIGSLSGCTNTDDRDIEMANQLGLMVKTKINITLENGFREIPGCPGTYVKDRYDDFGRLFYEIRQIEFTIDKEKVRKWKNSGTKKDFSVQAVKTTTILAERYSKISSYTVGISPRSTLNPYGGIKEEPRSISCFPPLDQQFLLQLVQNPSLAQYYGSGGYTQKYRPKSVN